MTKECLDRVIDEYNELTIKAKKLADFINSLDESTELSVEQIDLLSLQLETMNHYRTILKMRLNLEGIHSTQFKEV